MAIRSEQEASLVCFGEPPALIELKVIASREGARLTLDYRLSGELERLNLPFLGTVPGRRDGLWESTCFEAFLSEDRQDFYWELNVSPTLDWNLFHFRSYRDARKEEARIPQPRLQILTRGANAFHLRAELDLSGVIGPRTLLDLALTAVLAGTSGGKTYWALSHLGEKPDFHLRKSFQVRV